MLIPWGTDAPIYHKPYATVAVIVLNVLVFVLYPSSYYWDWTLVLGEGMHPLQWVANIFMHLGIGHLIGNMIFLWAFGIVVEGKLGAAAFLAVYLGIGVVESAILQAVSHPEHPVHMLGASGVIYGLLAMCLVWAPRNELNCWVFFRFVPFEWDVPILWFAIFYIGLEVFDVAITGLSISSALPHAGGAMIGFAVAVGLLKAGLVDCEDWDLFAVLEGRQGKPEGAVARKARRDSFESREREKPARARKPKKAEENKVAFEDPSAAAVRRLRGHFELGEVEAALGLYQDTRRRRRDWRPPDSDWLDLIKSLIDQQAWDDAVTVMTDYLKEAENPSPRIRLKLAQFLVQKQQRPARALRVLGEIPEGSLPESLDSIHRQLVAQAGRMREEGALELEDEV
jgi:membrane associated rhomboid family serine protease